MMDLTSLLAGILIGGIFFGFVAFILGIAIGALQGEKSSQVREILKDLETGEGIFLSKSREDDDGGWDMDEESDGPDDVVLKKVFDDKRRLN
jgi:hypothetical protein